MKIEIRKAMLDERSCVLSLSGRLNAIAVSDLKATLKGTLDQSVRDIVIDLADVSFIDSSGLAALIYGLKACREGGGWLRLAALREEVREIFRLTMIDKVFEIYPDPPSAWHAQQNHG